MPALPSVEDKKAISDRIHAERDALMSLGVLSLSLFGSFARGEQTAESDVDLLVDFSPEHHTFDSFMDLAFLLESILGRRVELVTTDALSPHIGPRILKEAERVYAAA